MSTKYNNYSKERAYTRIYDNLRGVDFSEAHDSKLNTRFRYLENMYVDYSDGGNAIESIPGFRRITALRGRINGLYSQKLGDGEEFVVVHAGNYLFRFNSENRDFLGTIYPILTTMANVKSCAFSFNQSLYILDGAKIVVVAADGSTSVLGTDSPLYTPTLTINGEEFEEPNLLNLNCNCKYIFENINETAYASPGLSFKITDTRAKTCCVTGIDGAFSGELHIPSFTYIDGIKFKVTAIGASAFRGNTKITALITNTNLEIIEKYAFRDCTSLTKVYFCDTLEEIEHYCFFNCTALKTMYIGIGFTVLGVNAMNNCPALTTINYAGTNEEWSAIQRIDQMSSYTPNCNVEEKGLKLSLGVNKRLKSVSSVTINGENFDFTFDKSLSVVYVDLEDKSAFATVEINVFGAIREDSSGGDFFEKNPSLSINPKEAITLCTIGTVYDGRIFLSGNPHLPGYVFYSSITENGESNPTYFSAKSFFVDGSGDDDVISILPIYDGLVVFKKTDSEYGSIFYHKPMHDSDNQTFYPVSKVLGGCCCKSSSYNFLGDAVFISSKGVMALEKSSGSLKFKCRSNKINSLLLRENLDNASISEWLGYLAVCIDGHIYLGDPRAKFDSDNSFEYEWYYLNGIGAYLNEKRVYRYCSTVHDGFYVHASHDERVSETVLSTTTSGGKILYYVQDPENGKKYEVYATDEFWGGTFREAITLLSLGEILYFGTKGGDICVFNNDQRGIPPPRVKNMSDFNADEYAANFGRKIHPDFYSFANHAPTYVVSTALDDCEFPHLKKNSVKDSLIIKCKNFARGKMNVSVSTDKTASKQLGSISASWFGFDELDFGSLCAETSDYSSIVIPECERGWIEKQINISSSEFQSPIGIYSIAHSYKIKGKIKNN